MTQQDFLNLWLDNQSLQPRFILNSSAFAMNVQLPEGNGVLSWMPSSEAVPDGLFSTAFILQDGIEEICMALDNLNSFPKLAQAILLEGSIPEELLLSIASAEFSAYAPWLGENIALTKIIPSPSADNLKNTRAFKIESPENKILQKGCLSVTTGLEERLGTIQNLNVQAFFTENPAPLPAWPCYAGCKLTETELQGLKTGDFILLPEWNSTERSADCLIIADNRIGAKGRQEKCNLTIQAPWQNFKTDQDEILIRGEEFDLSPLQALQLLENNSSLSLSLLSDDPLYLFKDGRIIAEGKPGEICGRSCMEITCTKLS